MALFEVPEAFGAGVTLARAEFWQCRGGRMLISTDAAPAEGNSAELIDGQGIELAAGVTVRVRTSGGGKAWYARLGLEP